MRYSIFSLLPQDGPFATGEQPPGDRPFSPAARAWATHIKESSMASRYRVIRNQIFDLLDMHSFADIKRLIKDKSRQAVVDLRAFKLLGNMFGIEGNDREIISRVQGYSRTADNVIRYLQGKIFANYSTYIEMTNEITAANSPVQLLLTIFDERYSKKARFEAKRKLILLNLAGSIDQRERETNVEIKFAQFLDFLNEYVWSKEAKIGELEVVYLLSAHDRETFSCTDVKVIDRDRIGALTRNPGQKLTVIKRRRFMSDGRQIPVYVSVRKKPPEVKVLKLLRKGEENPAVAVDDELGLMAVLDSAMDVKIFHRHLTQSAIKADSFMTLEEVSDTLTGGMRSPGNIGSSSLTPMFKFFARMGGMRVEFIVHTNKSYLNYMYQRDISHDEYEVKRIFDSGVADLLFPQNIYALDMKQIRNELIYWFRKRNEES